MVYKSKFAGICAVAVLTIEILAFSNQRAFASGYSATTDSCFGPLPPGYSPIVLYESTSPASVNGRVVTYSTNLSFNLSTPDGTITGGGTCGRSFSYEMDDRALDRYNNYVEPPQYQPIDNFNTRTYRILNFLFGPSVDKKHLEPINVPHNTDGGGVRGSVDSGWAANEASPAWGIWDVDFTGLTSVEVPFVVSQYGEEDWLAFYFDNDLLWNAALKDFDLNTIILAQMALGSHANSKGTFTAYLHSFGAVDAQVLFPSSVSYDTSEVPVPAALPLFAAGLGAIGFLGMRKKRNSV